MLTLVSSYDSQALFKTFAVNRHTHAVPGYTGTPSELAEAMGDLYYSNLAGLLELLAHKLERDSNAGQERGREKLAEHLSIAARNAQKASREIDAAWQICKKYV